MRRNERVTDVQLMIHIGEHTVDKRVDIGDGVTVPPVFGAVFAVAGVGTIDMTMRAVGRSVVVSSVTVEEATANGGVPEKMSFDGVTLPALKAIAIERMAFISGRAGWNAVSARARAAARLPVDDVRLRRVAELYGEGGQRAVREAEGCEPRYAWKLIRKAKEQGFISTEKDGT